MINLKIKVLVSILIFVCLFAGAWLMNEKNKRNYIKMVLSDNESIVEYILTPTEVEAESWDFKSREYIKIRKRIE